MVSDFIIRDMRARQILDSRGNPTLEVDLFTKTHSARAAVPSGASTGIHEALELRDKKKDYLGQGVSKAVSNVNTKIKRIIVGHDCRRQADIDDEMIELDDTKNKSALGANAILGVSLATAVLSAKTQEKPLYSVLGGKNVLPIPCMNVINGGVHANTRLKFQEFMVCPKGKNFADSVRMGSEVYHILKEKISKRYGVSAVHVGDEGGFAPDLPSVEDALRLLVAGVEDAGHDKKFRFAIDAASSELYDKKTGKYFIDGKWWSREKMTDFYEHIMKNYPVFSIEDPFEQDDFGPYPELTALAKKRGVQIVGDDLLVTNPDRIKLAMERKLCSALLLKVNQIGSLSESIHAAHMSMDHGWKVMVSHRSGETEDSFIADLVVGLGTGQIKSGAPCRSERLAKYNQLLRIEEELGKKAKYSSW
jgi:enolase